MKNIKTIVALFLISAIAISTTSCVVVSKHDNGHHKGWYKHSGKSNSPSSKPGKGNGKH